MKKNIKLLLIIIGCILLIIILFFICNPFYWGMKSKISKQPELSKVEQIIFQKLKSKYDCKVERFYNNFDSQGNDTLEINKYNKIPFNYSISIDSIKDSASDFNDIYIYNLGLFIKDSILKKNHNLQKIIIYKNYKSYKYVYDNKKDSLFIEVK